MSNTSEIQIERQNAIRQILSAGPADTQQYVVDQLIELGFEATQSSVSRDLKDINAIKTAAGYELPSPSLDEVDEIANVAGLLRGLKPAGPNLLIIQTAIGAAQQVALALDRCGWPEIVGNIGGDDTVFAATSNAAAQRSLTSKIERASTLT